MIPTMFRSMARTMGAPLDWDEKKQGRCAALPVVHDGEGYISCWKPSEEDRQRIARGECVYLKIFGRSHPVVGMFVGSKDGELAGLPASSENA